MGLSGGFLWCLCKAKECRQLWEVGSNSNFVEWSLYLGERPSFSCFEAVAGAGRGDSVTSCAISFLPCIRTTRA